MRPKERIKPFFDLVDWKQLQKKWNVEFPIKFDTMVDIGEYWNKYPDLRISQVLINMGYIPNNPGMWYYDEEWEILRDQGVPPEQFLTWTSYYDKDMKKLEEPKTRLIKDMCKSHINAVIKHITDNNIIPNIIYFWIRHKYLKTLLNIITPAVSSRLIHFVYNIVWKIKFIRSNLIKRSFTGEYNQLLKQAFDNVLNNPETPIEYE